MLHGQLFKSSATSFAHSELKDLSIPDEADADIDPHSLSLLLDRLNNGSLRDAAAYYNDVLKWTIIPVRLDKSPAVRFKKYMSARPSSEDILQRFWSIPRVEGLAVLNAMPSGGVVCRDFDDVAEYEAWASDFGALASTLPTVKTAKGYHVYFLAPDLTRTVKGRDGGGEFRTTGHYNVLPPSRHASGTKYQWVIPPTRANLVELRPGQVEALIPKLRGGTERTEKTQETEKTDETERDGEDTSDVVEGEAAGAAGVTIDAEIEALVRKMLPAGPGERHRRLFDLARHLKTVPRLSREPAEKLVLIVSRWHELALPAIGTKAFEFSWMDFLEGWDKVKYPAGTGPMKQIVEKVRSGDLPPAAGKFESPALKQLVGICHLLQQHHCDEPFYLSCRTAADAIGVTFQEANRYLTFLVRLHVLDLVEVGTDKGGKRRASRYRYKGSTS